MNEEMESTVLDTSGNGPASVVDSTPVDTPAPMVTEIPAEDTPAQSMEVISVDELLGRLTGTGDAGEEGGETGEAPEEAVEPEENTEDGDLSGESVEVAASGPSDADTALELLETIQKDVSPHPFLTTDFADYTVTEGLLLMALLLAVISLCVKMLKEGFAWL